MKPNKNTKTQLLNAVVSFKKVKTTIQKSLRNKGASLIDVLEHEVEDHLPIVSRSVAYVDQSDNVGMVVFAEVAEQRDLPQHGHGDPVLGQGDPHLLHSDDLLGLEILGLVHGPIGSCSKVIVIQTMNNQKKNKEMKNNMYTENNW
jgi:hypothetical protein